MTNNYRLGVGIILINKQKKIFAGRRSDNFSKAWQMPQGGIDKQENPLDAAYRELFEETSVKSVNLLSSSKKWYKYRLSQEFVPQYWQGEYIGQKQKWFLMEFLGDDSEINVATKEPEFIEWQWQDSDFLLDNIVDFKKDLYNSLFKDFKKFL